MKPLEFRPIVRAVLLDVTADDAAVLLEAITRDRLVSSLPGETLPASRRRRERLDILADRIQRAMRKR